MRSQTRVGCGGALLVQQAGVWPGLVQLHLGGGHRGEGAGLVQQARLLLAQLGICEGGLEHGEEGLQLFQLALDSRGGGTPLGGGGGVLGGGGQHD